MNNKSKFILFWVFLLFSVLTYAASFDCTNAVRPIDKAICIDPELSALDDKLASAYAKEYEVNPGVKEEQREWLKSLKQCNGDIDAIASCLKPMFYDRIQYLDKKLQNPPDNIASSSFVAPSQNNMNTVEQVQPKSSGDSSKTEKNSSEDNKSSFRSGFVAAIVAAIMAVIFMVFRNRKKTSGSDESQQMIDLQETRKVQTIAPIVPVTESKDPTEEMYQRALELLKAGSLSKASQLLDELSNRGHLNSQYQLGKLMLEQSSADGDSHYQAGIAWMKQAASLQHPSAILFLNSLNKSATDSVVEIFSSMSFDEWYKKLFDQGIGLDRVTNHFQISLNEIEKWRKVDKVPQRAVDFLSQLQDENQKVSTEHISEDSAIDSDADDVPDWDGVNKESLGYQMSVLISTINDDTWFPDGSTGSFIIDGSVQISSEEESIDDPGIFLENYDEMTLYRLKDYDGISFSNTDAISKTLAEEDNMWQFTYTFDFSEAVEPCEPLFPYSVVSSRQVKVRYLQFGGGTECGYRVDLASDLDLSWLGAWIEGIRERGDSRLLESPFYKSL